MSPRAGLDAVEKSRISSPARNGNVSFIILTEPESEVLGRIILCVLYDLL
jgi:hypothetical protein